MKLFQYYYIFANRSFIIFADSTFQNKDGSRVVFHYKSNKQKIQDFIELFNDTKFTKKHKYILVKHMDASKITNLDLKL